MAYHIALMWEGYIKIIFLFLEKMKDLIIL